MDPVGQAESKVINEAELKTRKPRIHSREADVQEGILRSFGSKTGNMLGITKGTTNG